MGLPPQALAQQHAFEVWPENEAPVRLFDAGITQWRMGPGGPVGLDYAGVETIARRRRLRARRGDWMALQVMESAALEWFAERRKKK